MTRSPRTWLGLAAAAALLAAGCTAQPQNLNPVNQSNLFTTTGDADVCAAALGNTVGADAFWPGMSGGNRNVTANGVIIGNVALVALPRESQTTPVTGVRADAVPNIAGAGTPGQGNTRPSTGVIGGRVEAPPGPGTPPRRGWTADMGTPGGPATAAGTGTAARPGATAGSRMGMAPAVDPLERVRTACPRVADIRVVNDENDRSRLAEITAAVRAGRPITEFMTELATIAQRATSAGPGANARPDNLQRGTLQPGSSRLPGGRTPGDPRQGAPQQGNPRQGGVQPGNVQPGNVQQGNMFPGRMGTPVQPRPTTPGGAPAPNAPGTDGRGSTPARPGTGSATDPGTWATD